MARNVAARLLLYQPLAGFEWLALMQKNGRDIRLTAKLGGADFEHVDVAARQNESVLREPDRSGHQCGSSNT